MAHGNTPPSWYGGLNYIMVKRGSNVARKGGSHSGPCGYKLKKKNDYSNKNATKTQRLSLRTKTNILARKAKKIK